MQNETSARTMLALEAEDIGFKDYKIDANTGEMMNWYNIQQNTGDRSKQEKKLSGDWATKIENNNF